LSRIQKTKKGTETASNSAVVEKIVEAMDALFGERSKKALYLAVDIAGAGNPTLRRLFEKVADHYRYE